MKKLVVLLLLIQCFSVLARPSTFLITETYEDITIGTTGYTTTHEDISTKPSRDWGNIFKKVFGMLHAILETLAG